MSHSLAQGHRDRASPLLHKHKTIGSRCACAGVSAIVLQLSCMRCAFAGVSVRWWRCITQGIRASEKELHIRPPCIVSFALSLCKSNSFWLQFARALCRIINRWIAVCWAVPGFYFVAFTEIGVYSVIGEVIEPYHVGVRTGRSEFTFRETCGISFLWPLFPRLLDFRY